MGSYASVAVRDAQGNIVGYQSTTTGGMVEVTGAASPAFQQQLALANAQKYLSVGNQGAYQQSIQYVPDQYIDTRSAAGIAQLVGRSGGAVEVGVAQRALGQGLDPSIINVAGVGVGGQRINTPVSDIYSGVAPITSIDTGQATVQGDRAVEAYKSRAMDLAGIGFAALQGVPISGGMRAGELTTYVPYGSYAQTELKGTKLAIEPTTGELAIYQQAGSGRNIYNLIGGGGRAALQSGMFSVGAPLTPYVTTQEGVGKYVLPSGEGLSRLGAEAYGGYVRQLDNRVLSPDSRMSTYESPYNLANLVNPQGANMGKAEAPGAKIPWYVSGEAPAISVMGPGGIVGATAPQNPLEAKTPEPALSSPYISTAKPIESPQQSFFPNIDFSGIVSAIQKTAPAETREVTSTEKQVLGGAYSAAMEQPVVAGAADFFGRIPKLVTSSIGFAGTNPELTPLGFVGGGGYAQESKLILPAAAAVVGGLVISSSQRAGYDLSPVSQKAQELWEGVGAPIQTPGAFNLPKITDVIPTSVFNVPGEGYRQIVNAPGEGYGLIVNLPGEGRNLIAKASEAIPMPSFGGGITDVIQFPRSTILPTDVITPVYDLTSKAQEKVTEVGRSLVTDRPIFDLSTGTQAKETVAAREATASQFSPDYATKLAAAASSALGTAVATPYWWTQTTFQSRITEQNRLALPTAFPTAYPTALPTTYGLPLVTPTAIAQPLATTYPTPYTPITPNVPQISTPYYPDYINTPGPRPPQTPEIKLTPGIPILPNFSGGGSYPGGMRRGRRPFAETFNIGLDISTFGSGAYNPFGGSRGGSARKRPAQKKTLKLKRGKK